MRNQLIYEIQAETNWLESSRKFCNSFELLKISNAKVAGFEQVYQRNVYRSKETLPKFPDEGLNLLQVFKHKIFINTLLVNSVDEKKLCQKLSKLKTKFLFFLHEPVAKKTGQIGVDSSNFCYTLMVTAFFFTYYVGIGTYYIGTMHNYINVGIQPIRHRQLGTSEIQNRPT